MSNLVFPKLPGLEFGSMRTAIWRNTVRETGSGRSFAKAHWSAPRWAYRLSYEFLRAGAEAELQALVGFFNNHKGDFETWLYDDPNDNTAVLSQFGVGNSTTVAYQLVRLLGGNAQAVYELNGAPEVFVDGVPLPPDQWSLGAKGLITFDVAPALGAVLRWSGAFYWRCRFRDSQADFEEFMDKLWRARQIEFITEKP